MTQEERRQKQEEKQAWIQYGPWCSQIGDYVLFVCDDSFHHGNASASDVLSVGEYLEMKSLTEVDHPSYSPDLVFCDFWLYYALMGLTQRYCEVFLETIF
jgi:hypothetical protein